MNFHEFVPQCLYGLDFMIISICSFIGTYQMKRLDKSNEYLQKTSDNYNNFIITMVLTCIFIIIGYYYYPPIIMISCLLTIGIQWIFFVKKINLLEIV
jgi:uncharacterized membrane protein